MRKFQVREWKSGEWDVVFHDDHNRVVRGSPDTYENYDEALYISNLFEASPPQDCYTWTVVAKS